MSVIFGGNGPFLRAQYVVASIPGGGEPAVLIGITAAGRVVIDAEGLGVDFGGEVIIHNILNAGPITIETGASAPVVIGQDTTLLAYNLVSLNGSLTDAGFSGMQGAADATDTTLYIQSQGIIALIPVGATGPSYDFTDAAGEPLFNLVGAKTSTISALAAAMRIGGDGSGGSITTVEMGPTAIAGTAEFTLSAILGLFTVPIQTSGNVRGATFSVGANAGVDGTIDATKTVTVEKGIVTAIV